MNLHRYFKPAVALSTASQTQLSPAVLREVNQAVTTALQREEARSPSQGARKRKYDTSFTPEDRAAIGKYAAENGNAAAVKKFKTVHSIGESTVCLFKKKYLEEMKRRSPEDEVTSTKVWTEGNVG